jgi:hypothetical protein
MRPRHCSSFVFLASLISVGLLFGEEPPAPQPALESAGPADPVLRAEYEALLSKVAGLDAATDEALTAVAKEIAALEKKLAGGKQERWAGELNQRWAEKLDLLNRGEASERAWARAAEIFRSLGGPTEPWMVAHGARGSPREASAPA